MTTATAQLEAVRRASLANVTVSDRNAWVGNYMIAARATRRGHVWEITDWEAHTEIGGTFPSAIAAVRYALAHSAPCA